MTEIVIEAGATRLVLAVGEDGRLHQLHHGPPEAGPRPDLPLALYPLAFPTFGEEPLREPALRVTHADGAVSTRLRFDGATQAPAAEGDGIDHRIRLVDRVAPLAVTLCHRTRPDVDAVEQWVEVANEGPAPCRLHQAASGAPALAGPAPHLTHWGGGWAGEWAPTTEALVQGTKTVASFGGVRSSLYRPPVVLWSPDGTATEDAGTVLAGTVRWGGDVRFDAEVAPHGQQRLVAGAQHVGAERVLDPGEVLVTPPVVWTWSTSGIGETSRRLHRFARRHVVRDGARTRATVANTWEAMFFALSPEALIAQVDRAAALGAELFLLDDGWFGRRDDDTTSLGDWQVDRRKLPDGLQPVIDHTLAAGLRFGLWVEPEMVNAASDLYAAHPDWVIGEPDRERREERNQLVLDLCRPEVREFVVATIDRVLGDHPGISYLKWDANRDVTEPGSGALPVDRQSHLARDRVLATREVMAEIARRHPDVELMLCASGGGRSDLDTLRWFHEVWTSDDTDPVDRVRIQWGASHLLPASVLGAHVTRWGGRPVAFGCAVAMSARFGVDLDLTALSDDEAATVAGAIAAYHRIREVVQHGDLHRLVSPVAPGSTRAALAHVADDRAVVFLYRLPGDPAGGAPVPVPGLAPGAPVTVTDLTPGRPPADRLTALVDGAVPWPDAGAPVATIVEIALAIPNSVG